MSDTTIKERPILFSAPMVRAILEGKKTQTRRVVKRLKGTLIDPDRLRRCVPMRRRKFEFMGYGDDCEISLRPYAFTGDRLWVRETWGMSGHNRVEYRASPADGSDFRCVSRWHPSIYMPRRLCRLTLEVTDVRIQRIQEISYEDIVAEGVDNSVTNPAMGIHHENMQRIAFVDLWDSINAKRGFGWDVNLWVWVIGFRQI